MLAHWFSRVGSIVAPDDQIDEEAQKHDDSDFWQFLAPDPNFQPRPAPPSGAFPSLMDHNDENITVECEHCHNRTRLPSSLVVSMKTAWSAQSQTKMAPETPRSASTSHNLAATKDSMMTPDTNRSYSKSLQTPGASDKKGVVEDLVLSAARDTALVFGSPLQKSANKLFAYCSNAKELKPKQYEYIEKQLKKDRNRLEIRSRGHGVSCPDGYTVLMAVAHSNHIKAAKIIMDVAESVEMVPTVLEARTTLGKSALHIASEAGSIDMVDFLGPFYSNLASQKHSTGEAGETSSSTPGPTGSTMPLDLMGRTPLGAGILSPDAKKIQKELKSALLTDYDESIFGPFKPYVERTRSVQFADEESNDPPASISYGIADIPGMRIEMEDSICEDAWNGNIDGAGLPSYCLVGVCDGHGDRKAVSEYVATTLPSVLKECIGHMSPPFADGATDEDPSTQWAAIWGTTTMRVDDSLRAENIPGGSTGVFALLTKNALMVANVGDSRCILIQADESSVEDASSSETPSKPQLRGTVAIPMSEDHKPNLPGEKARIENAGLQVQSIQFKNAEGEEEVTHKVCKGETDKLGVSRAFGDFEYKDNTNLGPHEQAVSCEADLIVRKRDHNKDLFLVLCCDGIFDVMSNENVKDFVMEQVTKEVDEGGYELSLPQIGDALCRKCFDLGSEDNMSVVIVSLQPTKGSTESPIKSARKILTFSSP